MRASMLLESDPAAAARHAGEILAAWPENAEAKLLLAAACRQLGDPAAATIAIESLARAHPASPIMQLELGRSYAACGRTRDALAAFQGAVELDAALADGWRELAEQRFIEGDTAAGDAAYREYNRLAPDSPELTDAHVALADGRLDAAEAVVRRRLLKAPRDVAALRLLAEVAARRGDDAEAEKNLKECLVLAPGYAAARYDLARVLHAQQRVSEALPHLERLLDTEPCNISYLKLKAQAMRLDGRNSEAVALIEGVIAERPDDADAWLLYGNLLREVGEQLRSIEAFRRALAVRPGFGEAYWALANLKTFRFSEEDVRTMQGLLERSPLIGSSRSRLEFALGKALEDSGQFAASFEHYAHGNALHRGTIDYDPAAIKDYVQRSKALYTAGFFAGRSGWGSERPDPIFIVGLPRSGSTLLEQILASHSQVEGTRELADIPGIVADLVSRVEPGGKSEYPEPVASLGRADIEDLAARYLRQTEAHRPLAQPRFVDKMLGNFNHVGLIHLMFPRAAIIDARRHPLGCGLSCYRQLFARGMNFSYHLGELGLYYRDYVELMDHLDAALPGRVHRVHYEQLVTNPESEMRRLLNHCRLPFEAECLRFYDNQRIVQTVSSEQVRRPIYLDGVDQWRHYEPWLGPLKEALGDVVDRYPAPDLAAR
jgi:tetratricopeptide (TPR) repeat protein